MIPFKDIERIGTPACCNHNFCSKCLIQWTMEKYNVVKIPICPLCRKQYHSILIFVDTPDGVLKFSIEMNQYIIEK